MPTRYFRSRRICLIVGRKEVSTTMQQFDAIVVGAGPAGSSAALAMARAGLQVALIERGEYPGAKNVSGAALYAPNLLAELLPGYWEEAPLERYLTRRAITFLGQEAAVSLDFRTQHFSRPPYNGFTILRPRFDRWLASKAEEAGAVLITSTVVDDLLYKDGRVIGVLCRRQDGELYAPIVIAADGANSFLAKKAGLQHEFRPDEMTLGVKEVLRLDAQTIEERFNLSSDEGMSNEYVGYATDEVKGGGFLYTNRDTLSIGVIVQIASLAQPVSRRLHGRRRRGGLRLRCWSLPRGHELCHCIGPGSCCHCATGPRGP